MFCVQMSMDDIRFAGIISVGRGKSEKEDGMGQGWDSNRAGIGIGVGVGVGWIEAYMVLGCMCMNHPSPGI